MTTQAVTPRTPRRTLHAGFAWGTAIGTLGGLIGLGGAEFRLPVLVGTFRLPTLEAVIANKAMSLVVVVFALLFRSSAVPFAQLWPYVDVVLNLLAGSLVGAWWAAGHALRMSRRWLDRIVMGLLIALALLMLAEHWLGLAAGADPLLAAGLPRLAIGVAAGFGIGTVAAVLGVAGGELLIPTIVLLFGVNIKLAGSLSLLVSLPTMIVAFARYRRSGSFAVLARERALLVWMAAGSVAGVALGSLLVGLVPTDFLVTLLGAILLISAAKVFRHRAH